MKAVLDKIRDVTVLIETVDVDEIDGDIDDQLTMPVSAEKEAKKCYEMTKELIKHIAKDMESGMKELTQSVKPPDELELEFGLAISAKTNLAVFTAGGNCAFKVKMSWKKT